ncbi:polysaccharide biosynthesis tyrosine autokinase [Aeromonas caviae]
MTTSSVSSRQSSAAVENDEIDLGRLLGYLIDGRWWIVTITALFMVLGVAYALLATPVFKANALLQVEKKASGAALLGDMADMLGGDQPDAAAEIELLTSRMVLGRTVQELHLDTVVTPNFFPLAGRGLSRLMGHPYPKMAVSRFEVAPELLGMPLTLTVDADKHFTLEVEGRVLEGQVGKLLEQGDVTLLLSDVAADEGQVFTLAKQPVLDVIAELQRDLQVMERKNTGIISLALEGEDKGRIRAVLDNISKNYLQQNVLRKTEEAQKSLDFLQTHLPQVKDDLNRSEELLNTYRQQNESVDLSLEAKAALDTMVGIEKQLNELTFREAELQQLYTRQHPAYIALMEKRQTLINTKNNINKSIKRLPKTQQDILRLTRDVQVGQEIFVQLLNKQQELNIMKAGTIGNVRIIDDAAVETRAVKPKKPLIVVLATLLGGMLSVGLILVRAAFHRGVESPEQLEEMGLSVYATIPYSEDQAKIEQQQKKKGRKAMALNEALLAARNPADLAMESLRSLRTSLHFAMMEAKNNIVMISGPGPGLGKTFVSTNFAATLAMGGKKVLVIDADLRKGYMQKVMGQEMGAGLSAYLAGQSEMMQVISKTGFDGLDFVCRGAVPPNPSELLMHPRFKALLDWAAEHYDFVIVDSPPILAVTDAAIVGQHVGASLLVARFAKTAVKEVEVAIRRFEQNGVAIKGILLNAVEKKASSYYGNYGYYQYSYGDKTKA